jgi:hypothetical protein
MRLGQSYPHGMVYRVAQPVLRRNSVSGETLFQDVSVNTTLLQSSRLSYRGKPVINHHAPSEIGIRDDPLNIHRLPSWLYRYHQVILCDKPGGSTSPLSSPPKPHGGHTLTYSIAEKSSSCFGKRLAAFISDSHSSMALLTQRIGLVLNYSASYLRRLSLAKTTPICAGYI